SSKYGWRHAVSFHVPGWTAAPARRAGNLRMAVSSGRGRVRRRDYTTRPAPRRLRRLSCGSTAPPQPGYQAGHVRGKRRLERAWAAIGGMPKAEAACVERLTGELDRAAGVLRGGVAPLANQHVSTQQRLDPDLVAPAGVQP